MPGKIGKQTPTKDDTTGAPVVNLTGPLNSTVDITEHEDFYIQVVYGAGAIPADNLQLEASSDSINFDLIPGSQQSMVGGGSSHSWNVTDAHHRFVRVVVEGASTNTNITFTGSKDWD